MSPVPAALESLRSQWERLSERERILVAAFGVLIVAVALCVVGYVITRSLSDLEGENDDMRQVLTDIESHKDAYLKMRDKAKQLESRLSHGQVQLGGLLESAARESLVEIGETNERQPVPVANKKYIERGVDLRIPKVSLDGLAHFLRKIETGPNLVVVTGLSVRVRDDRHEDLAAEMTVSTWEKAPEAKPGRKKEGGSGTGGNGPAVPAKEMQQ
jgi:hypothetical protein